MSLAEEWIVVGLLVATTVATKAAGPVSLGGRELPAAAMGVISQLAPAILAALVVTETFQGEGSELVLDERALGLAGAGAVLVLRGGVLTAMAVALVVTAGARAAFG
jgi:branched-subunit amino acid transport protein